MLLRTVMVGLSLVAAAGSAWSQACSCVPSATRLNVNSLQSLFPGRTACAVLGQDRWQEFHNANFTLLELGNTAGGEVVGSWSIIGSGGNGQIRYTYSGGTSYDYQVCEEGTGVVTARTYHFCGARNITNARLVEGAGGCGAGFTRP